MREKEVLVARTDSATLTLTQILANAERIQSGQRGYVISGDPAFLIPYEAALNELPTLR